VAIPGWSFQQILPAYPLLESADTDRNISERRKIMPSSMIEVNGLVKKYGDRVAVRGVSFSVLEDFLYGCQVKN